MTVTIEVFADITCPFTHVGLKVIAAEIGALDTPVDLWVRAWPLEWVNGTPLGAAGVAVKAAGCKTNSILTTSKDFASIIGQLPQFRP